MSLKKTLLSAAAVAVLMSGAALANAQGAWSASGNVALTSDYKFRGISQSNEDIAIQGGFDLSHESGFYIGTWGSSVDFDTDDGDYDGSLELDAYIGYGADIGDSGWSYDVGYLYYAYPGDEGEEGDYQELYFGLGWNDLSLGVAYSDDYYAESDEFWYLYADYSFALPSDVGLDLHIGLNLLEEGGGFLATDEDQYVDYSVSLSRDLGGLNFALAWVGTDLDEEDVFDTDWGDDIIQLTISKEL